MQLNTRQFMLVSQMKIYDFRHSKIGTEEQDRLEDLALLRTTSLNDLKSFIKVISPYQPIRQSECEVFKKFLGALIDIILSQSNLISNKF